MKSQNTYSKFSRAHMVILLTLNILIPASAQPPVLEWQSTFGGSDYDMPSTILQTADGGYLAAGTTLSADGVAAGNHGGEDGLLFKVDANGNLQWSTTIGGAQD